MEILGVLGCGFGPDYGAAIPLILGGLVVTVAAMVAVVVVAIRRGRSRRRTDDGGGTFLPTSYRQR